MANLKILALDCQATGANPEKGSLLEISWMADRACSPATSPEACVQSFLIRSRGQTPIPAAVARITGISDIHMADAVPAETAWRHLMKTAVPIAARNPSGVCPTIIHFARFEIPFLRELHQTNDPEIAFPFQIICTHAIAVRLLPTLPRRGLRALAGYFDHSMSEFRRSADHVLAIMVIWKGLFELLQARCRIDTLPQLTEWLAATPVPNRSQRTFPMNPLIRQNLPEKPGIYRMLRANAEILYIGKTKSLKQRVSSYFRAKATHSEHILEMLTQARGLDFNLTGSALEAAVLECEQIKDLGPPYNVALHPGQHHLVFCTKDLKQHAASCDPSFGLGPLPGGKPTEALKAFGAWLTNDLTLTGDHADCNGYALLGLPSAYAPPFQCLQEGFDLFRSTHLKRLQHPSAIGRN